MVIHYLRFHCRRPEFIPGSKPRSRQARGVSKSKDNKWRFINDRSKGEVSPSPSAPAPAQAPPRALGAGASLPPARCPAHMQSVTAGEGRRASAHTGPAPRRQRQRQRAARLLCPSALTQHALPGPELSRSCSPGVRAAGRNRKFGTVLVVGPGVLNTRPFAWLCRSLPPPPPSGRLPWGPFRGLA